MLKRALLLVGFVAFAFFIWRLRASDALVSGAAEEWVHLHPVAALTSFLAVYILSVIGTLPTLPLNLAAGVLWGTVAGGLLSGVAATSGALVAFIAARRLFGQPLARRFDSRAIAWLQEEFDRQGWRLIAFVRINPVFPTGLLNYLLGLTSIAFRPYAWATLVFVLPPSVAIAWIGHTVGTVSLEGWAADVRKVAIGIAVPVTLLIVLRLVSRYVSHYRNT